MSDLGKIDRTFFDERIASSLGADRDDVTLGPRHGVDFGVLEVGGKAVVTATDPLSILPGLGLERAARFALDVLLADVAVSGVPPSHLSICFTLPPEMTDDEFATVWETIHRECADLGTGVVTGHTARYSDCSYPWVGAGTALGVGDPETIVRPDDARVGDRLVVTTGPGAEAVGLLSTLFGDQFDLPAKTVESARERLEDVYCVRDALTAAAAGPVTAMHDVTEGGLAGALNEMAAGTDARFSLERDRVPMRPGVEAVCEYLEIDPWQITSCGSLVIGCDPDGVDDVLAALESQGTVAADVGRVEAGEGVFVDGERLDHPEADPSWEAYARLAEDV